MPEHKSDVFVLSDVHIGDNSKTCWYQKDFHEPYLLAALEHVISQAQTTRALIILGDLFDLWTYPGHVLPATVEDIIAANPAIFGKDTGALPRVLDALGGEVYFLPGNHDMSVDAEDLSQIVSANGHSPKMVQEAFYSPAWAEDGQARVTFSHGHHFTMFNAPDMRTKWAPMPVGHFVTRMVASKWDRKLDGDHTVADLEHQGAPNGVSLAKFLGETVAFRLDRVVRQKNLSALLLDWVADYAKWPADRAFVMPDGSHVLLDEVKSAYNGLWSAWANSHEFGSGDAEVGQIAAFKSAWADAQSDYMGWFAQRQLFLEGADLMVMGHTHAPISGLENSLVNYINSGFECPSRPDMKDAEKKITLAKVDVDQATAQLMQVSGPPTAPSVTVTSAPRDKLVTLGMDFSCVVEIHNTTDQPYRIQKATTSHGYFAALPNEPIAPGQTATVWVADLPGAKGSEAKIELAGPKKQTLKFACPTALSTWPMNWASGGNSLVAKSKNADGKWGKPGKVPKTGHPLFIRYEV
ncbi:MAG: metallophosphoesterase [Pseudomonadota bacterium]